MSLEKSNSYEILSKLMNSLLKVLNKFQIDKIISDDELLSLHKWINKNKSQKINSVLYFELLKFAQTIFDEKVITQAEIENLEWVTIQLDTKNHYFGVIKSEIRNLQGINGVVIDKVITVWELLQFQDWVIRHKELDGSWPYDEIKEMIKFIVDDGIISEKENLKLKEMFLSFIQSLRNSEKELT